MSSVAGGGGGGEFAKTVCSICYEDLKPIVEDLQVISVCGHVFHELCLQQWFEYIPAGKKSSCPVCKQFCSQKNVNRLYFQSTSEPSQPALSPGRSVACAKELIETVKRLEAKICALNVAFERQQQHLKDVNEEVSINKDRVLKGEQLKVEALRENSRIKQMLEAKVGEVSTLSAERSQLQDRCLALAKELAALKLVSDVSLDEQQVSKLASLGGGANNQVTMDILQKSLILRNQKYKELLAQCNQLGRGETLSLKKLEKAEGKIKKLKTRVQELERALEEKDNEILRSAKPSQITAKIEMETEANRSSRTTGLPSEAVQSVSVVSPHCHAKVTGSGSGKHETTKTIKREGDIIDLDPDTEPWYLSKNNASIHYVVEPKIPDSPSNTDKVEYRAAVIEAKGLERRMDEICGKDVAVIANHNLAIIKLPSLAHSRDPSITFKTENLEGDPCFSASILGPEGGNRYLGKWCRRGQNKLPSSGTTGNLIVEGSDGKGGRIKILRSQSPVLSGKRSSLWPKRCKYGHKTSSQAQGSLQIDDYFLKKEPI